MARRFSVARRRRSISGSAAAAAARSARARLDIETRHQTALEAVPDQLLGPPAALDGLPGHRRLAIEAGEVEIGRHDVGDHRQPHRVAGPRSGEEILACGLRLIARPAEEVELERDGRRHPPGVDLRIGSRRHDAALLRQAGARRPGLERDRRQAVGARQAGERPRLLDPRDSEREVVVGLEAPGHQGVELRIFERLPPVVGDRRALRARATGG